MKLPGLFTKTPRHKRFSYEPRFYDAGAEDRKAREERIRRELKAKAAEEEVVDIDESYRTRIAGSFRSARRTASRQSDPSASLIRLIILLFLVVIVVAYLQFGSDALYGIVLFVPFYLYLKFKRR